MSSSGIMHGTTRPSTSAIIAVDAIMSVETRLARHLQLWLGAWPPTEAVQIIIWSRRDTLGWDGGTWLGLGVESPLGAVLSLSPRLVADPDTVDRSLIAAALCASGTTLALAKAVDRPSLIFGRAVFRWSDQPAAGPEIGVWVPHDDPRLPAWLQAFNGEVLVAWDDAGDAAAGVGVKRHNRYGHELAVGTEPAHRGLGLGRLLVAPAARRVLASGAALLYFHDPANVASAHVADAAGSPIAAGGLSG